MDLWMHLFAWIIRSAGIVLFVVTTAPFVHTGWWVARVCDFPRLQLALVALALAVACGCAAMFADWRREPWFWALTACLLAAWQASYVVPFTRSWPRSVPTAASPDLSLVVANLDFRNNSREDAAQALRSLDADVYLLIEVDEEWLAALKFLRDARPHRAEHIEGDGLGMVVWSRHVLTRASIEFLVSEHRPSIHATVGVGEQSVNFVALHPTPPGLPIDGEAGRHDSRIRDAELLLVADRVADDQGDRWIVAGDFNDVAWSRTTSLFQRQSGLLDPRVGRGLLNTYHADYTLLRYPLDHVFVSDGFRVGTFERFRVAGSDHFGVHVQLEVSTRSHASTPEAAGGLDATAREVVGEGMHDAASMD